MLTESEINKARIYLEVSESETDKLNEWEQQFIESVSDDLTTYNNLTENQFNKLKQIYDKVV